MIGGSIDVLEAIGRKTYDVLAEGEHGLKKTIVKSRENRPTLSQARSYLVLYTVPGTFLSRVVHCLGHVLVSSCRTLSPARSCLVVSNTVSSCRTLSLARSCLVVSNTVSGTFLSRRVEHCLRLSGTFLSLSVVLCLRHVLVSSC